MKICSTLLLAFLVYALPAQAQENSGLIEVTITNIDSDTGRLYAAIYDSQDNWLSTMYAGENSLVKDGKAQVVFNNIPKGDYAISVFHDENDNQKLDMNFLGIPKETTGCSNDAKGFMGAPKWGDAVFELSSDSLQLHINL